MSGTNGGASITVSGTTSSVQQQAIIDQITYNAQNNIPFSLSSAPGDTAGASIASSIMSQVDSNLQGTAASTPNVGSQVAASTTGNNAASTDWFSELGQGASSTLAGGAAGDAAAGSSGSVAAAAAGGGATAAGSNLGAVSNTSFSSWLSANLANDGLVVMGALLVLGALLISQRQNIQTAVTKGAEIAAV